MAERSNYENLPRELRDNYLFCLWRYEMKDDILTKVPYCPHDTRQYARVNVPETFDPYDIAVRSLKSHNDYTGIGVRIDDDLVGVDIDHCINDEGLLSDKAERIIELLDSYTETSPSGHGLRIFLKAPGIEYSKEKYYIKHDDLEIYIPGQTNRYLTVTGNVIRNKGIAINTEGLTTVLNTYFKRKTTTNVTKPTQPSVISDLNEDEIIEKARNAKNGAQFTSLWEGNWQGQYESQSNADMALCNLLAFWTQKDAMQMDSLFRRSGLYRSKWDRKTGNSTYGIETINKAIANTTDVYTPSTFVPPAPWTPTEESDVVDGYEIPNDPNDPGAVDPETGIVENAPTPKSDPEPTPDEILDEFWDEIQTERFKPIPTGLDNLDKALSGGLERKTIVTLAAAPGAGKTSFCQYLFENMAKNGHHVIYVNLEMDRSQLLSRSIARIAYENKHAPHKVASKNWEETAQEAIDNDVTALTVRRGYDWTPKQQDAIRKAFIEYRETIAPRFHYVTANSDNIGHIDRNLTSIVDKLEKITQGIEASGQPAPLICIDYLQFVTDDLYTLDYTGRTKKPDTAESIAEILATLKDFAMRHSTVVLVIMANNRTSNKDGRASMDSGRDTSNIEYSGDTMLSLTYTAIEDHWKIETAEVDKDGNIENKVVSLDMARLNARIDYCEANDYASTFLSRKVCIKVVKGRGIEARKSARFIFDGAHASYIPDTDPVEYQKVVKMSAYTLERLQEENSHATAKASTLPPT